MWSESRLLSSPRTPAPSASGLGALQMGGSAGVSFCWCSGEELEACLCLPTTLSPGPRSWQEGQASGMGLVRALLLCFQGFRNNFLWPERILPNLKLKGAFCMEIRCLCICM